MITYYVSFTSGNDSNDGSLSTPWKTLDHAQTAVQALLATQADDITVRSLDVEPRTTTLALDNSDSGQNGFTVIWDVQISGATRYQDWTLWDGGKNIWRTPYSSSADVHAIWVQGRRATQAIRTDASSVLAGGTTLTAGGYGNTSAELNGTRNQTSILFVYDGFFTKPINRVASVGATTITMHSPGHAEITTAASGGAHALAYSENYFPIERRNVYEDFYADAVEGTFYADLANDWLYYIPQTGEDLATAEVYVPNGVEELITIDGAEFIELRGQVQHAHWTMSDGLPERQMNTHWTTAVPRDSAATIANLSTPLSAVRITDSTDISLFQFDILRCCGMGLHIRGASEVTIDDCCIADISMNGEMIGHPDESSGSDCPQVTQTNCTIAHVGQLAKGSAGIFAFFMHDSVIENNLIFDTPYNGIGNTCMQVSDSSSGSGWISGASDKVQNNSISYNRIQSAMRDRIDGGGIYCADRQHTLNVKYNALLRVGTKVDTIPSGVYAGVATNVCGLYFDEQTQGDVNIDHNVIRYCNPGRSIRFNDIASPNTVTVGVNYADTTGNIFGNAPDSDTSPTVSINPWAGSGAAIVAAAGPSAAALARHMTVLQQQLYTPNVMNVALHSNGAVMTSSSEYSDGNYGDYSAHDGDRKGLNWGTDSGWGDNTESVFDDYLIANFVGPVPIDTINIFTLQDTPATPVAPTLSTTCSAYGIKNFDVQTRNSDGTWTTRQAVTNNTHVWTQVTLSPAITTDGVRILVHATQDGRFSRIVELEAWSAPGTTPPLPRDVPAVEISGKVTLSGLVTVH